MDKPTIRRKEREKEARREAILDAAAQVFSRKNFHEATLDEIASEAELAKGTLYNYYKDKQDIFASLIIRGHRDFQEQLSLEIERGGTLQTILVRILDMAVQTLLDHKYMFRMVLSAGEHLSESYRTEMMIRWQEQVESDAQILVKAFDSMPETKNLPEAERLTGAYLILAAIRSLHHRQMLTNDLEPIKDDIDTYSRLLCRALRAE